MQNWKHTITRHALMFGEKEACFLYEHGNKYSVTTYLDGACYDAGLAAATLEEAMEKAIKWYVDRLQKSIIMHNKTIAQYEAQIMQFDPAGNGNRLEAMEPLKQRDKLLEEKWLELEDVPFDPETEKLEAPFLHFPAGTDKEDIWHWFDERHSKGIVHLLYHEGIEHYPELQKLFHRRACCFDCDSETCALNPEGVCLYPLLYGNAPEWDDHDGCKGFLYKEA